MEVECEGSAIRGLRAAETLAEMKESRFSLTRLLIFLDDPFLPAMTKVRVWEALCVQLEGEGRGHRAAQSLVSSTQMA